MPKVDPETGQPISDAPDGPLDTRGGMERGDPGLAGATETGGSGAGHPETGTDVDDSTSTELPGQKGGAAGGGGQAGG
jgi:hypothetical protein